jgi:hypothetical protein
MPAVGSGWTEREVDALYRQLNPNAEDGDGE